MDLQPSCPFDATLYHIAFKPRHAIEQFGKPKRCWFFFGGGGVGGGLASHPGEQWSILTA